MKTFSVWYMKPDYARDGFMGSGWLREHNIMPDPSALDRTHVHLLDLDYADSDNVSAKLEDIFRKMQGEVWSPNGEARVLIESKGLAHTSMSVGDVVVADGHVHMVDSHGFLEL
jgi:hypothetical protein